MFDIAYGLVADIEAKREVFESQSIEIEVPRTLPVEVTFQMYDRGTFREQRDSRGGFGKGGLR